MCSQNVLCNTVNSEFHQLTEGFITQLPAYKLKYTYRSSSSGIGFIPDCILYRAQWIAIPGVFGGKGCCHDPSNDQENGKYNVQDPLLKRSTGYTVYVCVDMKDNKHVNKI